MSIKPVTSDQADHAGSPSSLSLFESISVLNECRDLAAEWLSTSLEGMLKQLEDALFEQADRTFDRNLANVYLESRALVQSRRSEIERQFRQRFVETFNGKISAKPQETSSFGKISPGELELSLVANEAFEEQLAVEDIAKRFKEASGSELNALDQRIGFLLQRAIDERDNPLSPEAIAAAFKAACEDLDFSSEVKRVMLEQFNNRFISNVPQFYQTINQHLVARNVMPVIRTIPRIARAAAPRIAPSALKPGEPLGVAEVAQAMEQGDWQQVLSQLMGRSAMSGPATGASFGAAPGGTSAAADQAAYALLNELNRLQHSQLGPAVAGDGFAFAGGANILHELKSGGLLQLTPEKESITIDIVAMLFDYIFDDKSIPASIKALIGRLQIPVLKVAILDNKFFSKKSHPARKLLDSLAAASIGLSDEDGACQRLEPRVARIVQRILTEFEDDIQVFVDAQMQLDAFLSEEEARAGEEAAKAAKSIYERERLDLARVMAADELLQRAGPTPPDEIRSFFTEHWSLVAAHAFLNGGEAGQPWKEAMETAENLVWSVAPKASVEDRMKLVTLLPDLLKRLEKGLAAVQTPQEVKEAFFAALVQCHAQAIKSGVKSSAEAGRAVVPQPAAKPAAAGAAAPEALRPGTAAAPEAPKAAVSPARAQLEALEQQSFDPLAGSLAAALTVDGAAAPAVPVAATYVDTRVAAPAAKISAGSPPPDSPLAALKRGSLVEMPGVKGERVMMKLAWVSPLQGVYLFTNREGQNARSIDKGDLEQMLRQGQITLVENTGLFDRAMTTMVSQLQSSAA